MANSDIIKLIPTMQSASMALKNYETLKNKKKKPKDLFKLAGYNITGSSLIKAEGEFLGGI